MSPLMQSIMNHVPKHPITARVSFYVTGDPVEKTEQEIIEHINAGIRKRKAERLAERR